MKKLHTKIISVILAGAMAVCLAPFTLAANLRGDINGDNKVNSADALMILQYSVGQISEIDSTAADINGDGKINSADALEALKISVGIVDDPVLKYSKDEIVKYYNDCLNKTYAETNKITGTSQMKGVITFIDDNSTQPYDETNTFNTEFIDGEDESGYVPQDYGPLAELEAAGAKTATVKKISGGYEINITVVEEKADIDNLPKYNSQCALPITYYLTGEEDYLIDSTDITYTGTTINAKIDLSGRVTSLSINMPFSSTVGLLLDGGEIYYYTDKGYTLDNIGFDF